MKTLREYLIAYSLAEEGDNTEEGLEELLRENFEEVWEGDEDERRWCINYYIVVKITIDSEDRFFKFSACKGTNDNSWEDVGYSFEGIDNVQEVTPKEVKTTVYV